MTSPRRRNALITTVCIVALSACGISTSANQSADTIGPIGIAPAQPATGAVSDDGVASTGTTTPAVQSAPVRVPPGVVARADTGRTFMVTETSPSDPSTSVEITDPRILFVGDSVSLGMAIGNPDPMDAYVQSLGWKVTLDGRVGRFTAEGIQVLKKRSSEIHQVLVLMLGNNYGGNQDEFRLQVAQILQLAANAKRIIMFTVPIYAAKQKQVNQVLHDAAASDPRLTVIDWETASRSYQGALSGDGIHPTNYGAMILDQMLAVTLGPAPGGPADATLPTVGDKTMPATPSFVKTNKGEGNPSIGNTKATLPTYKPTRTTTIPKSGGSSKTTTTTAGGFGGGATTTTQSGGGSTVTTSTGGGSATTRAATTTTTTTAGAPADTKAPAPTQAATTTTRAAPVEPPPAT